MILMSWILLLLISSWQILAAPQDSCRKPNKICCSKIPEETNNASREINDTSEVSSIRSSSCPFEGELKTENYICKKISPTENYTIVSGTHRRGKGHLKLKHKRNLRTECKCDHRCEEETTIISCGKCTHNKEKAQEDSSWSKATFGIVIGAIVVGVGVVFIVICRRRIKRSRGDQNGESQRNIKRRCEEERAFSERLQYTFAKDLDSASGTYSLPYDQMAVRRHYRPLRQSAQAAQDFQLQPFIHRPFEDDNKDETYTEIIELDTKCDSRHQTHYNAILHQAGDITFLETECSRGGDIDRDCYNRLGCQGNEDKLTDHVSTGKENYGRLHRPTQARLSGGYNRTNTATDVHIPSIKIEGEPAHDDTLPDTSTCCTNCDSHTSAYHTPYDNSLLDLTLSKETQPEHGFPDHTIHNTIPNDATLP
ncbi:uncharacterized protein LOC112560373 isoform X2 [Pomacea canaliculata]|uniref:uncharacterized protein LOC112560373 isoform X2 n=1 Tax=Pomacea canaliculata TaxID=400727 RepID=UPI000D73315D|nr:uncharacterized protein LOC112560373 isoform X2 [Pomacea canaliculata]